MLSILILGLIGFVIWQSLTNPALEPIRARFLAPKAAATADQEAKPAAKAAGGTEKKKEGEKEKKLTLMFSYWLFLFFFIAAAFIVPPYMTEGLSGSDTWLLVLLSSLAATFAVSTAINYFFDFDETITKINKVVVVGLLLGFGFLLYVNNFSTTGALKDAGALASKPFDGGLGISLPSRKTNGRQQMVDSQFIGEAYGETYTIRDDTWSVFTWKDGYCIWQFGGVGLFEQGNDPANTYAFRSPSGTQRVEVKLVRAGDSWKGEVCK